MKKRITEVFEDVIFDHEYDEDTEMEVRTGVKTDAIILAILMIELVIMFLKWASNLWKESHGSFVGFFSILLVKFENM